MSSWDKVTIIGISVIYLICFSDFLMRNEEDFYDKEVFCGKLSKVDYSSPAGIRGSGSALLIYVESNNIREMYRFERKITDAYDTLKPFAGEDVCVGSLSSPLLSFLVYPIEVRSSSDQVIYKESLETTYLNSGNYVFWFFLIPIAVLGSPLAKRWAHKKRENA